MCELERMLTQKSPDSKKALQDLKKKLDLLASKAKKFSSWVHTAVEPMIKKLSSLDCDETDLKQDIRECTAKLKKAQTLAEYFIKRLDDFFELAASNNDEIQNIKYSVQKGEVKTFKSYISQLRMVLENCRKRYEEFEEKHKDAKEFCEKTSRKVEAKVSDARDKKNRSRLVGTGTAIAGSIVAGIFTLGIGTVVGLTATAAGVSALYLGQSYAEIEKIFKSFREKMDELSKAATDMGPAIFEIQQLLMIRAKDKMDDVDRSVDGEESGTHGIDMGFFCTAFDSFVEMAKSVLCMRKEKDD